MVDSHARSVAKAVSWRAIGTVDTFVISWLITGTAALAGGIAATEVFTKVVLFYLHERAWSLFRWDRSRADAPWRSVAKAISWRITGTVIPSSSPGLSSAVLLRRAASRRPRCLPRLCCSTFTNGAGT